MISIVRFRVVDRQSLSMYIVYLVIIGGNTTMAHLSGVVHGVVLTAMYRCCFVSHEYAYR
jgi:hypothetical protein